MRRAITRVVTLAAAAALLLASSPGRVKAGTPGPPPARVTVTDLAGRR
ncbi:MAG TPA: hypothetical protein GXX28_10525, partial [Firmicutes bacterium]|nr:hypothetical protein [Bacillota bacterium]